MSPGSGSGPCGPVAPCAAGEYCTHCEVPPSTVASTHMLNAPVVELNQVSPAEGEEGALGANVKRPGPVMPVVPVGPEGPVGPVVPVGPVTPVGPVDPT